MLTLTTSFLLASLMGFQDPGDENRWSGTADAGLTLLSGNNNGITTTVNGELNYAGDGWSWLNEAHYAGVRQEDATGDATSLTRLYQAGSSARIFLDDEDNLYAYGKTAGRANEPNGLQLRADLGGGIGYLFKWGENDSTQLAVEGGPSWLYENNVGTLPVDAINGRAATRLESDLGDGWSLLSKAEYFQSFDESENRSLTGEAGVRWNFEESWFLQATAAVAWDNTPATGFKKTDTRYILSIGTSF